MSNFLVPEPIYININDSLSSHFPLNLIHQYFDASLLPLFLYSLSLVIKEAAIKLNTSLHSQHWLPKASITTTSWVLRWPRQFVSKSIIRRLASPLSLCYLSIEQSHWISQDKEPHTFFSPSSTDHNNSWTPITLLSPSLTDSLTPIPLSKRSSISFL